MMQKNISKIKRLKCVIYGMLLFSLCRVQNVLADTGTTTGTDDANVVTNLNIIKGIFLAGIATWGVVTLAKNIAEFSNAMQQQDNSGMWSAGKGIIGGILMAGISGVIALFTF